MKEPIGERVARLEQQAETNVTAHDGLRDHIADVKVGVDNNTMMLGQIKESVDFMRGKMDGRRNGDRGRNGRGKQTGVAVVGSGGILAGLMELLRRNWPS